MKLSNYFGLRSTRQNQAIPGSNQVRNSAGGFVWKLDPWMRLDRFLILGTEGGTYYIGESKLTVENASNTVKLIEEDGLRVVRQIVEISQAGRAPKQDAAIFALALCSAFGNDDVRREALASLPKVARTGTHLFQFAAEVEQMRGWGRALRRAVGDWYLEKSPEQLAYQAVKYQQRNGWSHRDLLRLSHPRALDARMNGVLQWIVKGDSDEAGPQIEAFEKLKTAADSTEAAKIIREAKLPREAVPTELLNHAEVWEALLEEMPMTAMLRNLATMTRVGLLQKGSEAAKVVIERLLDESRVKAARVHPLAVLIANRTYAQGHGFRGSNTWDPVRGVVDALDDAFLLAFRGLESSGKRWVIGLDVSGSMGCSMSGTPVSCAEGAAAMTLAALWAEPEATVMAFSDVFKQLDLRKGMTLETAMKRTNNMNFGGTDCSLPMTWAMKNHVEADVFVVYTDNETWAGDVHPVQALRAYRQRSGIDAKLIVVGMASSGFTIADPDDPGMLDIVGFDAAAPTVMREFAL